MQNPLRKTLPVTFLLLTFKGRINRLTYWYASLLMLSNFYVFYKTFSYLLGVWGTIPFYPLMLWGVLAVSAKRFHDTGKSGYWFVMVLIPILGPLYLFYQLALRKGDKEANGYGDVPESELDYFKNDNGKIIPHLKSGEVIIDDVTGLNPILVDEVFRPKTRDELVQKIKSTRGIISVGGGRFSMGGQTASNRSLHIDMRGLNRILDFSDKDKTITVETGIRWCDIQEFVDPYNLSVKIMQTYANFTVGGSLNVNVHGRYMGLGPVIFSVKSIKILLADGTILTANRQENKEIFFGAIGAYNAFGIILEATLELADNVAVQRVSEKLNIESYSKYFDFTVKDNKKVIFHNADIYPPDYNRIRAVSWEFSLKKPNVKERLMPLRDAYPVHRYFLWEFSETPLGKWRREFIMDPILFFPKRIHWRNYEAGYDIAELEPMSRKRTTYVLQEYFVPIRFFEAFTKRMGEILNRYKVNVINISVRHALADKESYLAWAKEEVFAYVMYYKQRVGDADKNTVAIWTRELIDLVLEFEGSYYLPYQAHATKEQFIKAYPNYKKLFDLKTKLDPEFRFRNVFWDTYYEDQKGAIATKSEFKRVFNSVKWSDAFYKFLQNIFHIYPEDRFHALIQELVPKHETDEEIYQELCLRLRDIKPFLSDVRLGLPSLLKQKEEMVSQTLRLLKGKTAIQNYAEIGSVGRYISVLRKRISIKGSIYLINEKPGSYSPPDIFERGGLSPIGKFVNMGYYDPIPADQIPNGSLDLITCYIGLHHIPLEKLEPFIKSISDTLKRGGNFILRDHDVKTEEMHVFVSLVHTVFNAGLQETLETEKKDFKRFRPITQWVDILSRHGLKESGERLLQKNDPTDNTLLIFTKE